MATTKADKEAREAKQAASSKAMAKQVKATNADRKAEADLVATQQAALINKPIRAKADPEGNIDQRMAALLKDHQDMGARPK